ncbi:MAG: hypothetical protein NTW21_35680 [Verrucomicrobia bacterium]|nr:hypothetical protein [Verrucomicrobiota bacterium]
MVCPFPATLNVAMYPFVGLFKIVFIVFKLVPHVVLLIAHFLGWTLN